MNAKSFKLSSVNDHLEPEWTSELSLMPKAADMAVEWESTGSEWMPLGPVATVGSEAYGAPDWQVSYSGDAVILKTVIEFPELVQYVGLPSFTFFEIYIGTAASVIRDNDWKLEVDLSEFYAQADLKPTQGTVGTTFASFIGYLTGLLVPGLSGVPKITILINSYWTGDATSSNIGGFRFDLNTSAAGLKTIAPPGLGTTKPAKGRYVSTVGHPEWEFVEHPRSED